MDRGAWWSIVHGIAELNMTEVTEHTHTHGDKRTTFDWYGIGYDGDEERGHECCLDF